VGFDAVGFKTFDLALVRERHLIVPGAQEGVRASSA
jgi:hypothetical protein